MVMRPEEHKGEIKLTSALLQTIFVGFNSFKLVHPPSHTINLSCNLFSFHSKVDFLEIQNNASKLQIIVFLFLHKNSLRGF